METELRYLDKHSGRQDLIAGEPEKGLKYIAVIPAYLETRLTDSLVSLLEAERPGSPAEVITVVNWPEGESPDNLQLNALILEQAKDWCRANSQDGMKFHIVEAGNIPQKKAGVGYARKTGMDEAVRRFVRAGQEDGIILSFDADSVCDGNYFTAVEDHFLTRPDSEACSIYFEHPLSGETYSKEVYRAIVLYELHMRCYLHAMRSTGYPNAYYTVGSSFAVRADGYYRQGGMNTRKAGEDFYFLQKFADPGLLSELNSTRIIPSPRPSLRVPFGTGKSIHTLITGELNLNTHNPKIFDVLREFFAKIPGMYDGQSDLQYTPDPCLSAWLELNRFDDELQEIRRNSAGPEAFVKRFYRWFNMFRILKFAKFASGTYPEVPVAEAAMTLMQLKGMPCYDGMTEKEMLELFRKADRGF